ncbi:ATP-binding protein [Kutzneria buriramensis]|uniref:ATP-binding protein n=1 Tax=Kutzneria buriramensis TaxID=1045776 RepID=UPI000E2712BB|nr:ATP-binding protein [Kutzneria buriramensis]
MRRQLVHSGPERPLAPPLVQLRQRCGQTLAHLNKTHLGDVLLVAVELVTNAYDHGGGARQVRLKHSPEPGRVRIEVDDNNTKHPRISPGHVDQVRGRGLIILDQLADEWGVRDEPGVGGKCVWAVISCSGADRAPTTDTDITKKGSG